MAIQFDPKNSPLPKGSNIQELEIQTTSVRENGTPDPIEAVREMDLLFGGIRRSSELKAQNPSPPIHVPDFEKELLGISENASSPFNVNRSISNYKILKKALLERRKNFFRALKEPLSPFEKMDIQMRIEEIDEALSKVERNLERALRHTEKAATRERELNQKAREQTKLEKEKEEAAKAAHDYLKFETVAEDEEGNPTIETRRQA